MSLPNVSNYPTVTLIREYEQYSDYKWTFSESSKVELDPVIGPYVNALHNELKRRGIVEDAYGFYDAETGEDLYTI